MVVDECHLTATATITWPRIDLMGYFIEPNGGDFARHRRNPKVNLFHARRTVAWCRDSLSEPGGEYTVKFAPFSIGGKSVKVPVATLYFDPYSRDSMVVFDAVARRRLSGVSVEIDYIPPIVAMRQGRQADVIQRWWLKELAIVRDPANPMARIFACDFLPRSLSRR